MLLCQRDFLFFARPVVKPAFQLEYVEEQDNKQRDERWEKTQPARSKKDDRILVTARSKVFTGPVSTTLTRLSFYLDWGLF